MGLHEVILRQHLLLVECYIYASCHILILKFGNFFILKLHPPTNMNWLVEVEFTT
jgi:hypothetical protein